MTHPNDALASGSDERDWIAPVISINRKVETGPMRRTKKNSHQRVLLIALTAAGAALGAAGGILTIRRYGGGLPGLPPFGFRRWEETATADDTDEE